MRWLDTTDIDESTARGESFWQNVTNDIQSGTFWADEIKELKDNPPQRLEKALDNLPLPAAFREAAIALRAIIRASKKSGQDLEESLQLLYSLSAFESFGLDYASKASTPGFNILESIPGKIIQNLEFNYKTLGYEKLRLLNKTDCKWLVEVWGDPTTHTTLNEKYRSIWDNYEEKYLAKRNEATERLINEVYEPYQPDPQSPSQARKTQKPWWKFW
jgi:hypothetical protein